VFDPVAVRSCAGGRLHTGVIPDLITFRAIRLHFHPLLSATEAEAIQDSFHNVLCPPRPASANLHEIEHLDQIAVKRVNVLPVIGVGLKACSFDTVGCARRYQIPFAVVFLANMHLGADYQGPTQYPCVGKHSRSRINHVLHLAHRSSSKNESRARCHDGCVNEVWAEHVDAYALQTACAAQTSEQAQHGVLRGAILWLDGNRCKRGDGAEEQEMAVARLLGRVAVHVAVPRPRVLGKPEIGKMRCVHDTGAVDVHDLEVWWGRLSSVEIPAHLHHVLASNSSVGDNSIQPAMRTQLDSLFEEVDLRLPLGHVALDEVDLVLACDLLVDRTTQLVALLYVDVTNDDRCAVLRPVAHESRSEATRSSRYEYDLAIDPACFVGYSDIDRRGLADGLDHALVLVGIHVRCEVALSCARSYIALQGAFGGERGCGSVSSRVKAGRKLQRQAAGTRPLSQIGPDADVPRHVGGRTSCRPERDRGEILAGAHGVLMSYIDSLTQDMDEARAGSGRKHAWDGRCGSGTWGR
jgi:hypothetical protein